MKLLIVDDNPDVKEIFTHCCEGMGVRIDVVDSGLVALSYLEENEADAVLVDLAMPTFDGISCVQEIRRNEKLRTGIKPVRLAFYTAHNIDTVVQRVMIENRVEKVFKKPIDPHTLIAQVKEWLVEKPYTQNILVPKYQRGVSMPTLLNIIAYMGLLAVIGIQYVVTQNKINTNYLATQDKQNAQDAYRTRELIEQRNRLQSACEENGKIARQNNPAAVEIKPCTLPPSIEKE